MKVGTYYSNEKVLVEEQPVPKINNGEILIKVKACGICGSDIMEWYRIKKAPLVLGHEVSGVVVESKSKKFNEGDRVFVTHHVPCGECKYCKRGEETVCDTLRTTRFYPGGFAEFLRVPKINVEKGTLLLPNKISFEEATFIEPLGCVVRAQKKLNMMEEDVVAILGSGVVGILHIQLVKLKVNKVISTDINPYKLKKAKEFGANITLNANELNELVDKVIICTSSLSAINQAFEIVDRGGEILFFAPIRPEIKVDLPLFKLWKDSITLKMSYAASKKDLEEALKLINERKVKVKEMITHQLPLEKIQHGFNLVANAKNCLKVIIKP